MGASDANMRLSIDTDESKAVSGLVKLENTERRLDVAIKAGNKTIKARIDGESDLAKVLGKVEAAEQQAITTAQKRAKASLAAQKSAALLADIQRKAAKEQRIAAGFESSLVRAQMEADGRNHERAKKRITDLAKAQEMQRGAMRRGVTAAASFAGSMAGVGTAAAAAALLVRGLTAAHEHQMDVAKRSDSAAKGLKEFVALQAEGPEGKKHVQEAVLKGAKAGVSAADVGTIAQPIQSVVDANGDGRLVGDEKTKFDEDYAAALKLKQIGVSAEDAQTVVTSNRAKGIGGTEAANKLIAASDVSAAGPADFSRAASSMGQFKDSDTALAVTTALTQEEKNFEQLPTLVRGAAKVLGEANDESDFSKKYGLAGLSEADKITKLREEGKKRGKGATEEERIASFSRSFRNDGMDEEAARAMGILVRQQASVESTREKLQAVDPGLADKKVGGLLSDPLTGSQMRSEQAAATSEANALYGTESAPARDKRAAALARGAELQQYGGDMAVNEDGTERGFFDPRTWWGRGKAMMNGMPGTGFNAPGPNQAGGSGTEKLETQLDALQKALEKNTSATEANSAASKGKSPVGGATSNAEEKY